MPAKCGYSIHFSVLEFCLFTLFFLLYGISEELPVLFFLPWHNSTSGPGHPHYRSLAITLRNIGARARAHTHTHTFNRLLWTNDQPDARITNGKHRTLTTDSHVHAPGGI